MCVRRTLSGLVVVALLLVAGAPAWSQTDDETVTISWGQDEEDGNGDGILSSIENLPGRGDGQAEQTAGAGLELPRFQYSAGLAGGVAIASSPTVAESDTRVVATGSVRYALSSPLIGDSFRSGRGQQVGVLAVLGGDSRLTSASVFLDMRSSGSVTGAFAGIGTTMDRGLAVVYGVHVSDRFLVTGIATTQTGVDANGDDQTDVGALIGVEYLF